VVLLELLMLAGVLLVALPALALGVRGVGRHRGRDPAGVAADRISLALLYSVRVLALLLVLLLSAAVAVSAAGALVEGLDDMPSLVTVFFVLDLLLAALVLLTFGRRDRRPARRRGTPARR
jgi:hypothetical protein